MQARIAFNGGEFAPELDVRSDLDKYPLGCRVIENWSIGQLGGLKRRKGMRTIDSALSSESRLIPYIYSYANGDSLRFIVEVSVDALRVFGMDGEIQATFQDGEQYGEDDVVLSFQVDPKSIRYMQINKLLILTSLAHEPMVLKYSGSMWEFEPWEFKQEPWRYTHDEIRDTEITVSYNGSIWDVNFGDADYMDTASPVEKNDILRVSYRTERKTINDKASNILNGVTYATTVPTQANEGDKFAVREDEGVTYFVCISEFPADAYVEGLESPAMYSNAFRQADIIEGFEEVEPVYSLKDLGAISKGTKVAIKSQNWHYYTCIKRYSGLAEGFTSFDDYPEYFIEGLPIGEAVACRGGWAFTCSGTWYGEYQVKRCFEKSELTGDWELRGTSRSFNDTPTNKGVEGDESEEECFMRLFITRSRCCGDEFIPGFPADSCHNSLSVDSYLHDIRLKAVSVGQGDVVWSCDDVFKPAAGSRIRTTDWSWAAFSDRYGYPLLSAIFNQRLVFASTEEQPQTLWMSRVDDLNNFLEGEADNAAICGLTLNTSTQDPICWIKEHKKRLLLGTSSAEFVIAPEASNAGLSSTNIASEVHSDQGSDGQRAISMPGKVVFVGRGGKRAYEFGYNYEADGYIASDLTMLAPHIGRDHGGLITGSAMDSPDAAAAFVTGDGQLAMCTYNPMQEVRAWHRWTTDGFIHDVCVMPNGSKNDSVYLLVERDGVLWLEVVDEQSEYVDADGRDYTSTVVTNTIHLPTEKMVINYASTPFAANFGDDLDITHGKVEFTTDGSTWYVPASNAAKLPKGWVPDLVAPSQNGFGRKLGMRVSGNIGAHLLAMQG